MPRRLFHQSDVSATSGANVAEVPSKPKNNPWASANPQILSLMPAHTNPIKIPADPISKETVTPQRSTMRPIYTPPTPNPIIMSVYGKEASDRLTPNSACTSGRTTATANMQLLPISIAHRAMTSRLKAYRESISSAGAGILLFISHPEWRQRNMQTQTVLHCRA